MTEAETEARNALIADLYQRHVGLVRWVIDSRYGHDHRLSVEDIVQTAFERAVVRWRDLVHSTDSQRRAWLCEVARNHAVDQTRALSFRMSVGYDPVAHDRPNSRIDECPEAAALANERVAALGTVVAQLPDVDRQTLVICARGKQSDIIGLCQHMGITRKAGKSRAYRARERAQKLCAAVDLTA